ncbi:sensor domain-containing protein [Halochromatium sp.]
MAEDERRSCERPHQLPTADFHDLYQRARELLAGGRFDLAETVTAEQLQDVQALVEELRIREAELRLQNEELSESRDRIEAMLGRFTVFFNSLPIAAMVLEARGMIRLANPAAEALLGLRPGDHQRYFFARFLKQARRNELIRLLSGSAKSEPVTLTEVELQPRDGPPIIGDIHLAPLPNEANAEPEFICSLSDRSESVRQRQRLQQSVASLEHENAARRRAELTLKESQTQLEAIFQAAPVGIVFACERRILQSNAAWFDLIGYTREELCQRDTLMIYRDDDEYARIGQELYEQMRARGTGRLEAQLRHKDGHLLDVVLCGAPIDKDSAGSAVVVTVLDITERKRDERALAHSRWRLAQAERIANLGAFEVDVRHQRLFASAQCRRIHGTEQESFSLDELLDRHAYPADRPRIEAALGRALAGEAPYRLEQRILRANDGAVRWVEVLAELERDADQRPLRLVGAVIDITDRKVAEQALKDREERLRLTLEATNEGLWDVDLTSGVVTVNERYATMLGYALGELTLELEPLVAMIHPDDRAHAQDRFEQHLRTGTPYAADFRMRCKDGRWRWIHGRGKVVAQDPEGRPIRVVGTNTDIHERKLAKQALNESNRHLREAAKVFESTDDAIMLTSADDAIVAVNPAFTRITGYTEADVRDQTVEAVLASAQDHGFWRRIKAVAAKRGRWQGERWERNREGASYRAFLRISGVSDDQGQLDRHIIVISDRTRLYSTQQQVDFLTQFDGLTGLLNRRHFQRCLTQALQDIDDASVQVAILLIDLDRFRIVNESIGPAAADELLRQVAHELRQMVRPTDVLARLGGDEFAVLLPAVDSPEAIAEVAERLQRSCAGRRIVRGQTISLSACVGIAVYPRDGHSGDELMRHADIALKQAKARGRHSLQYFEHAAAPSPSDRLRFEACLSQAMFGGELSLQFQPLVCLSDGQLAGAEALLRWTSPELGAVSPQQFIPVAEDMGLIHQIGDWVLRQAMHQLAAWDRVGRRLARMAVNLSILQLDDPDLVDTVAGLLNHHGLAPERLELELTESLLMAQAGQSESMLAALRGLGVHLAIDDFGTGYSSLAYLHRMPLHQLKIDRSFIDALPADPNSQAITNAVIALGKSLKLEVLAEGVENAEQAEWLRAAGCSLAQGYYYSRPLTPEAFAERWL